VPDEEDERRKERANRFDRRLGTFCRCNDMLLQIGSEQEALQSICKILTEDDEFCLAWVGYSEDDSGKNIRSVAEAGDGDVLERLRNSWETTEIGKRPPGLAVQTGKPHWINDISVDPRASGWGAAAVDAGYVSCIALPLIAHNQQWGLIDLRGTLNLYSAEPEFFDDATVKHYADLASCLTQAVAALRGYLANDLTSGVKSLRASEERRRAEDALQTARAELARASRLTVMGQLAASIAHEINQPLAAIVAYGNAALRWLANEPPNLENAREALSSAVVAGHRAGQVIESIRTMFKQAPQTTTPLDINDLVREVLALTRSEIQRHHVAVQTELMNGIPKASGDHIQLQQVMLNLIINALEAMDAVTDRPRVLNIKSAIDDSKGVLIMVGDNGTGIEPKNMQRIFDSFFTTKSNGMGMGLSICRSIIETHGGSLSASSGDPHGTIFQVILPTSVD
jgi:signal transduction histidine kinase